MCGIAGFVEIGAPTPQAQRDALAEAMGRRVGHRGPDEATALHWRNVSIAFRRLSINDLDHGRQPFHTPDGTISTLVNGELYNHRALRRTLTDPAALRTQSDCEVLPQLYAEHGDGAFRRINGMFAAVILDRRRRQLVLARDRMGIKPLYYATCPTTGQVVFGSELKAVMAHPGIERRFDWTRALQHASWPMAGAERLPSGFVGIECVPPGGTVRIDLASGAISTGRYWQLDDAARALDPPLRTEAVERFRALLADSVQARLMADAGIGLFLSGGIDSVAIAALAAPHRSMPTFSVWNGSTLASGDAAASRQAARAFGLPNHAVRLGPGDAPTPEDWRNLLWACELHSITAEQWFKFRLHACARRTDPSLKVILLGQGADEFLGGYLHWLTGMRRAEGREAWAAVDRELESRRREDAVAAAGVAPAFRPAFDAGWLNAAALAGSAPPTWVGYRARYRANLDYHLWHEDRTAAAHGIENRVPFLDHRLLEFMASLPEPHHARWFTDKRLLRQAIRGTVPEALAERPKGYFFYGGGQVEAFRVIAGLMRAEGGALLDQALAGSRATDGPLTASGLHTMAARVMEDPALRGLTPLLFLVNMGVLADLANRIDTVADVRPGMPPELLTEEEMRAALAAADDAPAGVDADAVFALAGGLSLLEMRRPGIGDCSAGTLLVAEGDRLIQEVSDPGMAKFLCAIDGRRSLATITRECDLDLAGISVALPEALELGLLARVR